MLASTRFSRYLKLYVEGLCAPMEAFVRLSRRLFSFLLLFLPLAYVLPVLAQDADPQTVDELIAQVEATYRNVNTIRADFVQVTRSATMGEQKQRGKVALKRPKMMRWDSTSSGGGLFVTNGQKMWLYLPTDQQVLVYNDLSNAAGVNASALDLLTSFDQIKTVFDVTMLSQKDLGPRKNSIGVTLRPKKESQFKEIRLILSKRKYELESITTVDAFGVETEISFTQVRMNLDIPDSEFAFQAPTGVQVINADSM